MRTFYSEYVQHCMRFYARYPQPRFRTNADKLNWNACHDALKGFKPSEVDILTTVYRGGDTIPDNIYKVSVDRGIKQDIVWKLVNRLERKIAKRRNLI